MNASEPSNPLARSLRRMLHLAAPSEPNCSESDGSMSTDRSASVIGGLAGRGATLPPLSWRRATVLVLLAALVAVNLLLLGESIQGLGFEVTYDWWLIQQAHERIGTGTMYDWSAPHYIEGEVDYLYRYSPLVAYFAPVGLIGARVAHLVVLLLLPGRIALLVLALGPFWFDVAHGNFLTFIVIAAWFAIAGNRWGIGAFSMLAALFPRPLMLPVLAWLLWRRPASRPIVVGVLVVMAAATLATGEAYGWMSAMLRGGDVSGAYVDWGPSRVLGLWWWPIGVLISGWLIWKGRLGFASLAASPYVLPYYLLFGVLELRGRDVVDGSMSSVLRSPSLPSGT